jgi:hypothetical protein
MRLRNVAIHAACAYPIPLLFAAVSLVSSDIWYSRWFGLHGLGWAVLLLSLPWTLGRIVFLRNTGGVVQNSRQRRIARMVALAYVPVALACAAAISLALGFVSVSQAKDILLLLFFPFSLPGLL